MFSVLCLLLGRSMIFFCPQDKVAVSVLMKQYYFVCMWLFPFLAGEAPCWRVAALPRMGACLFKQKQSESLTWSYLRYSRPELLLLLLLLLVLELFEMDCC